MPIEFYRYRTAKLELPGINSGWDDVTCLPFADETIKSLSYMFVLEDIGLDRYGDTFESQGNVKPMKELPHVQAPRGYLLSIVPIGGVSPIRYNAHRIYMVGEPVTRFPLQELIEFALLADNGTFVTAAEIALADPQQFGCVFFLFPRPTVERTP